MARRRVTARNQGQNAGSMRRRHRGALDGRIALVSREPAAGEDEARDLQRPIRGDAEVLERRRQVGGGVGEARRPATIPGGQVELARAAWTGYADAGGVVTVLSP